LSNSEYDCDAWERYPQHRWVFNKLELSNKLGYSAGPGGVSVPVDYMDCVVRPIYNLSGMGVGARREILRQGDYKSVEPGYFWCEYFHGPQTTVDYEWQTLNRQRVLVPLFAAQGFRTSRDLFRFNAWKKITPPMYKLPNWISNFDDVSRINIEFIDGNIIEIHLRGNPNFPKGCTEIIPIWSDMGDSEVNTFVNRGWTVYPHFEDADGHMEVKRLGFLAR